MLNGGLSKVVLITLRTFYGKTKKNTRRRNDRGCGSGGKMHSPARRNGHFHKGAGSRRQSGSADHKKEKTVPGSPAGKDYCVLTGANPAILRSLRYMWRMQMATPPLPLATTLQATASERQPGANRKNLPAGIRNITHFGKRKNGVLPQQAGVYL